MSTTDRDHRLGLPRLSINHFVYRLFQYSIDTVLTQDCINSGTEVLEYKFLANQQQELCSPIRKPGNGIRELDERGTVTCCFTAHSDQAAVVHIIKIYHP